MSKSPARKSTKPVSKTQLGLLELLQNENWDPGSMGYLVRGMEKAVRRSMIVEPILLISRDGETKRRILLCIEIYRIMANDLKWGARRAADQLETYLLQKLRGEGFNFPDRAAWVGPGNLDDEQTGG